MSDKVYNVFSSSAPANPPAPSSPGADVSLPLNSLAGMSLQCEIDQIGKTGA
jgi:hypothetical protein